MQKELFRIAAVLSLLCPWAVRGGFAPAVRAEEISYEQTDVLDDLSGAVIGGSRSTSEIIPLTSEASRRSSPSPNTVTAFMRITKAITGCMYISTIRRDGQSIRTPTGTKSRSPMAGGRIGQSITWSFWTILPMRAMRAVL